MSRRRYRGGIDTPPSRVLTVLGALAVMLFFSFPYLLMFTSSLKSQADVRSIPAGRGFSQQGGGYSRDHRPSVARAF